MIALCDKAQEVLIEESNVVPVTSPVSICGDIHGQFWDLLELFRVGGEVPDTNYVFLGDYVDRGHYSLETITLLMCLKVKYPDRIVLLRGNHESRVVSQSYGFFHECLEKYGDSVVYHVIMGVFDCMTLSALIDNKILCIHGGLSPDIKTIDQIRVINRYQELPTTGPMADLLWSDPEEMQEDWMINMRGAGWLFGERPTLTFNQTNGLTLIARAHQLCQEGFQYLFDNKIVTVWSAPNYSYRCGNRASILNLTPDGKQDIILFDAVPEDQRTRPAQKKNNVSTYFL